MKDPVWTPDEGQAVFNPKAGATVTGARFPLIAFNVNLCTDNLEIARQIAKAVRHSSGGFCYGEAEISSIPPQSSFGFGFSPRAG